MKTETIKDKHGEYYKVTYNVAGKNHVIMGGDRTQVEQSAVDHIAKYKKSLQKANRRNSQAYGWA